LLWGEEEEKEGRRTEGKGRVSSTVKIVLVWSEPSKFMSSDFLAPSSKLLVGVLKRMLKI